MSYSKVVIIEGPDCVGKSTLIKNLFLSCKNVIIIACSSRTERPEAKVHFDKAVESNSLEEQTKHMINFLSVIKEKEIIPAIKKAEKDEKETLILIDRFYPSTFVYQLFPIFPEKNPTIANLIYGFKEDFEKALSDLGVSTPTVLFLDASDEVINQRIEKRNEGRHKFEKDLPKIAKGYRKLFADGYVSFQFRIDTSKMSFKDVEEIVKDLLNL